MEQETPQELLGGDRHHPLLALVSVIFPAEGNLAIGNVDDPVIGDGHTMRVASQIVKDMFGPSEWPFGVDHPVVPKQRSQESMECLLVSQVLRAAGEYQLPFVESALQAGDKLAAKNAAQHLHRQEEGVARVNPALMIGRETAGRDHTVDMRMVDALEDGPSNDGLMQRFQLLVWPDTPAGWEYIDRAPDANSVAAAAWVFRKLVDLDAERPVQYHFAQDAQELFVGWLSALERKIRSDELHPALASHLAKYRSLLPSLALHFELADAAAGYSSVGDMVSFEHTEQAAAWCTYLETHAQRIYSCVVSPQTRAIRELTIKIQQRKIGAGGPFTRRDILQREWSGLTQTEWVEQALEGLQEANWIRGLPAEQNIQGGRPTVRFVVNPKVYRLTKRDAAGPEKA